MWFWTSAAAVAAKMDSMRIAEERLLSFAKRFGGRHTDHYEMRAFDTPIPREVVPLKSHGYDVHENVENNDYLIHGVHVENVETNAPKTTHPTPLVLLHGYMNGSAYFFRNLVGLSSYFNSIYSLDMLGWGLSSRPNFQLTDNSVETAEDFFVESLEAWRVKNDIPKMILAGHSIGGYLSVAYCERYPQNVERLILLSPAGVTEESPEAKQRREARLASSTQTRMFGSLYTSLFDNDHTVGGILRMLPAGRSQGMIQQYIERRLPAIDCPDEQKAVADYLYLNAALPGSGEYCLNRLLTPFAHGRKPTRHRVPNLKIPHVSFLYGSNDWMDPAGGLQVQLATEDMKSRGEQAPDVNVYQVSKAGHLLMLENWEEFNAGVVMSAGGRGSLAIHAPLPTKLDPNKAEDHKSSFAGFEGESAKMRERRNSRNEEATVPVAPAS
jgi:cardiolipin-specific phospholipase